MSPGVGGGGGGGVTPQKTGSKSSSGNSSARARDSLPAMRKRWTRLWSKSGRIFYSNKNATDEKEIQKRIRDGEEARDFLTMNVLQGKMNERGNFETSLKSADPDKETWEVPKEGNSDAYASV